MMEDLASLTSQLKKSESTIESAQNSNMKKLKEGEAKVESANKALAAKQNQYEKLVTEVEQSKKEAVKQREIFEDSVYKENM